MKKLPILLLILCLCDIALTLYGLSIGIQEGNPLSQQIMEWWFVLLKILLSVVCVVCLQIAIPYFKWLRFIYIIPILPYDWLLTEEQDYKEFKKGACR